MSTVETEIRQGLTQTAELLPEPIYYPEIDATLSFVLADFRGTGEIEIVTVDDETGRAVRANEIDKGRKTHQELRRVAGEPRLEPIFHRKGRPEVYLSVLAETPEIRIVIDDKGFFTQFTPEGPVVNLDKRRLQENPRYLLFALHELAHAGQERDIEEQVPGQKGTILQVTDDLLLGVSGPIAPYSLLPEVAQSIEKQAWEIAYQLDSSLNFNPLEAKVNCGFDSEEERKQFIQEHALTPSKIA